MAVQKSRKSRSKRDTRRLHDSLKRSVFSFSAVSNEMHLRHHMTPEGFYRGKKINLDLSKKEKV